MRHGPHGRRKRRRPSNRPLVLLLLVHYEPLRLASRCGGAGLLLLQEPADSVGLWCHMKSETPFALRGTAI